MRLRKRPLLFIVVTGACLVLVLNSVDLALDNRTPVTAEDGFPPRLIDEKIFTPIVRSTMNSEVVARSNLRTVPVDIRWKRIVHQPVLITPSRPGHKPVPTSPDQTIAKSVSPSQSLTDSKRVRTLKNQSFHKPVPATPSQTVNKTESEVRGIQDTVPGHRGREIQKLVLDTKNRKIQKPVSDTEIRGTQRTVPHNENREIQKPFPNTKERVIQKPVPDTQIRGNQKTSPDTEIQRIQKPFPETKDRGILKTVPDTEGRETQKTVPDTKGHRIQKPILDTQGHTVKKSYPVTQKRTTPSLYKSVPPVYASSKGVSAKTIEPTLKVTMTPKQVLMSMNSPIAAAPVQSPKTARHVLLVSYFRSGSTFVGDLLQQNWKTFYTFEPMFDMTIGLRLNETQFSGAVPLLKDLMYCNFATRRAIKHLKLKTKLVKNFFVIRNKFLTLTCSRYKQLCTRPDFISYLCEKAPWHVMKVNRLSMEQAGRFVEGNPELDIRVLHLVRDPRGIMSSRKLVKWCNTTGCNDSSVLCQQMDDDYQLFRELKRQNPDRYFQLRYEDLASRPVEVSRTLFEVLGLPYTEAVASFLSHNTKAEPSDLTNPYSTRRNTATAASEWGKKLRLEDIKKIQAGCVNVFRNYDYTMVNSLKHLIGSPKELPASRITWLR